MPSQNVDDLRPSGAMDPHGAHKVMHQLWFGPVHAAMIAAVRPLPGERILDIGGGSGELSARIAASGATVVCVEPDQVSLARARERLAGTSAEFVEASAEEIPLAEASADGALISMSAHHWTDRERGFAEIARILRPGGRLALAEFRSGGMIVGLLRRLSGGQHEHAPDAGAWSTLLRAAGFTEAEPVRVGLGSKLALIITARKGS